MVKGRNIRPTIADLPEEYVVQFLLEHLKSANLRSKATSQSNTPDASFNSNQQFWAALLNERNTHLRWIKLEGFQVVDWFPRTPGLYHTEKAKRARREAQQFIREENGVRFYSPHGKHHMIEGGLGCVRFKPIALEREEYHLYTATSDGDCHSGVPLAIPDNLLREIDVSDGRCTFTITGQVKFLPKILEKHFQHISRIPQIYVLVERCEMIAEKRLSKAVQITPMVFFKTEVTRHLENEDNWYRNKGYVTYVNCRADSLQKLDQASDWLERYVIQHQGRIITNFDEQRPAFAQVPFSLQNIMSGDLAQNLIQELSNGGSSYFYVYNCFQNYFDSVSNVQIGDNCIMSNDRTINTGGGNYIESNTGTYVQGNYINMSQDLAQAAQQIQQLLLQLQNAGMTEEQAQQQVANDIAMQARTNPTFREKLVKWGQSLGDAAAKTTVSDIVKGVVKLAASSAGIPLP